MKKNKSNLKNILMMLIFIIVGMLFGFLAGYLFDRHPGEAITYPNRFLEIILTLIYFYIGAFLQVIIHEGGHLIAGLASGYKFLSFRIGNIMLVKNKDHLELKKYSLAGTAGQCLMSPPDMKDGRFPNKLYNLGGVLANLVSIPIAIAFSYLFAYLTPVSEFFYILAFLGLFYAITNGLPIKTSTINTDGYNALELNKDKEALFSLWVQLKMNEQVIKGISLKDMPEEWFTMPPKEKMDNSLISSRVVFYENRLMEEHNFSEALEIIDKLLNNDNIVGVYRELLKCDKIYITLIENKNLNIIVELYDKSLQTFIKQMKNFPSVMRTEYTYSLLYKKDLATANKIIDNFKKVSKKYPYPMDIETERELIEIAAQKSKTK